MLQEITRFCEEYQYPSEAVQTLLQVYESILQSAPARELFTSAREEYARSPKLDYTQYLKSLKTLCADESLSWESASLLFYICLVPRLRRYYRERNLPESLCHASLEDLKWKLQECRQVYGIWGSFVPDWFAGFFTLTRFTLGRLQFELTPFPDDYEKAGRTRPEGIRYAVNIHIPSSGPLLHEECARSYRLASDFFRSRAFVCDSWLLFPSHAQFLPGHSRILEFMSDFDIYSSAPDPEGQDLWRIFGLPDCSDIAGLPEDTSLRKAYKRWLLSGNTPGIGKGVFLLQ